MELKQPLVSEEYIIDFIDWIDEDLLFEVIISAVFLVIFLVTWCLRRTRE